MKINGKQEILKELVRACPKICVNDYHFLSEIINVDTFLSSTIPFEVEKLISFGQLEVTKSNLPAFQNSIDNLESQLKKCPKLYETDNMEEHPAVFHYFYGSSDFFICEYDGKNQMFGYVILGGDLNNSEWGYSNLSEITNIPNLNIDYHFKEQTVEAALYNAYPDHFKKPKSIGG